MALGKQSTTDKLLEILCSAIGLIGSIWPDLISLLKQNLGICLQFPGQYFIIVS